MYDFKVSELTWQCPIFQSMTVQGQLVAMFLLHAPHVLPDGTTRTLTPAFLAEWFCRDSAVILAGLQECERLGIVRMDGDQVTVAPSGEWPIDLTHYEGRA